MGKQKKSRKNTTLQKVVLATALIQLIETLMDFIKKLIEQGEGEKSPKPIIILLRAIVNILFVHVWVVRSAQQVVNGAIQIVGDSGKAI